MRQRVAHYLKPAGSTQLPRHHLVLDVETTPIPTDQGEEHEWRLACTEYLVSHSQRGWSDPVPATWTRPWELWAEVNWRAKAGRRLVIWCHNLAFDLRASKALPFLAALGFSCEAISLDALSGWARFTEADRTVILVDLMAWLPTSLRRIGEDLGIPQAPPPPFDAPDGLWEARCRRDVEITRAAVVQLLDLISEQSLGPWRPTGSGQSHSAWKHRFLTDRPLVHDQVAVLEAERKAAWTGRCEAWRWGDVDALPAREFDLQLAYCQIGADSRPPSVLVGEVPARSVHKLLAQNNDLAVLARVRIDTDVEIAPANLGDHIYWPVGRFETVLWDPELRLALEHAHSVEVVQAWAYRRAPVLQEACRWIIGRLAELGDGRGSVERRALKHWARALIGRCALRYSEWETWGYTETDDISLGLIEFRSQGVTREAMQIGQEIRLLMDREESPDSLPQIPGWIMSECRRRLWELMNVAGLGELLYVDTDSLLVTPAGARRLQSAIDAGATPPLAVKGTYRQATIHAPRLLVLDGERRAAGIPLSAQQGPDGELHARIFSSLRESLMLGSPDRITLMERSYRVEGIDRRREHLAGGRTAPMVHSAASEQLGVSDRAPSTAAA